MMKNETPGSSKRTDRFVSNGTYRYLREDRRLELREKLWSAMKIPFTLFFSVWLSGWTVACMFLIYGICTKFSVFLLCFAIPFWASWFFVSGFVLDALFGQNRFTIDEDGLRHEKRVFWMLFRSHIPLKQLQGFTVVEKTDEENRRSYRLRVITSGRPLEIPCENKKEAQYIGDLFTEIWERLREKTTPESGPEREMISSEKEEIEIPEKPVWIAVDSPTEGIEPPFDCRWKVKTDFDSVVFSRRGEFSLTAFLVCTFMVCFWNGGISIFILELIGMGPEGNAPMGLQWWGSFLFLVPFEIFGLVLLFAWFWIVLSPWIEVRYSIRRREIRKETRCLFFVRSRAHSLEDCRFMKIDRDFPKKLVETDFNFSRSGPGSHREDSLLYALSFPNTQEEDICKIGELSAGEARWLADVVRKYR